STQLDNAQLRVGAATSDMQIEQMSAVQGTTEASGVSLKLTGQDEQVSGAQPVTSGADNDPAQPGQNYMSNTLTTPPASTLSAGGGGQATLSVTSSAGD